MTRGRFVSSLTLIGVATFVVGLLASANGPALVAVGLIGFLYALALVVRFKRLGGARSEVFAALIRGLAGFLFGLGAGSAIGVEPPAVGLVLAGFALHAARRRLRYEKGGVGFGVVLAGVALVGFGGWRVFESLDDRLPAGEQLLAGAALLYVFWVLRVILAYVTSESDKPVHGFVGWLRQNFARNALFAGILVAYFVARPWISENVPMFGMVEFSFGMILFGAILARLRNVVKRDLAESPTASERRRHVSRIDARSEASYDRLAHVVEDFVERGEGVETYREVVAQVVGVEPDHADFSPIARFRETRPGPAIPFPLLTLAALAQAVGAALAALLLFESAPIGFALAAALGGFAFYRFQDEARAAASVGGVLGYGLGGSVLVAVGVYLGSFALTGGAPPLLFLGIVAVMVIAVIAVPVAEALRMRKRIANNTWPMGVPRLESLATREKKSRERATAVGVAALVLFVPLASAVSWLAAMGIVPSGFVASLAHVQGPLGAFLGGLFISYAILWSAARSARPRVESEETARRSRRLDAHRAVMDRLVTR